MATEKKGARMHRAMVGTPRWGVRTAQRTVPTSEIHRDDILTSRQPSECAPALASLCLLPLRFLQLLSDLVFFVASVLQMTLEQW